MQTPGTAGQPITNAECLVLVAVWNRWSVAARLWYEDKCWRFPGAYSLTVLDHFSDQSRRDNCTLGGGSGCGASVDGWMRRTDFAIADTAVNANLSIYCIQLSTERARNVKANVGSFTYVKHSAVQHLENTSIWYRFVGFLPPLCSDYFELSGISYSPGRMKLNKKQGEL